MRLRWIFGARQAVAASVSMTNHMPWEEPLNASRTSRSAGRGLRRRMPSPGVATGQQNGPGEQGRQGHRDGEDCQPDALQAPAGIAGIGVHGCRDEDHRCCHREGQDYPGCPVRDLERGETRIRFASGCRHSENARCEKNQGGDESGPEAQAQLLGANSVEGIHHVEDDDGAHARRSDDTAQPVDPPSGRQSETSQ